MLRVNKLLYLTKKVILLFVFMLTPLVYLVSAKAEMPKIDPSFAGGKVVVNLTETVKQPLYERPKGVVLQADGKIVVLGEVYGVSPMELRPRIGVIRYNPDGSLDNTFGKGGHVIPIISNGTTSPRIIEIVENNKILVVGWFLNSVNGTSIQTLFAIKLNSDGSADTSFGNNGQLIADLMISSSRPFFEPSKVKILSNGNYQVINIVKNIRAIVSTQITIDGRLDRSFGKNGIKVGQVDSNFIQPITNLEEDGKFLITTTRDTVKDKNIKVTQFNLEDLVKNNNFGDKGEIFFNHPNQIVGPVLASQLPDGKTIVVVSQNTPNADNTTISIVLYCFNVNGQLDTTFGNNGSISIINPNFSMQAQSLIFTEERDLIIGGSIGTTGSNSLKDFLLIKVSKSGVLDKTFGTKGFARTNFGFHNETIFYLLQQQDGKILSLGNMEPAGNSHIALVRYLPTGNFDSSFGDGGSLYFDKPLLGGIATDVVVQNDGKIIIVGSAEFIANTRREAIAVVRLNNDGLLDEEFADQGVLIIDIEQRSELANAVVLQEDGKILVAGTSFVANTSGGGFNSLLLVARINTDGKLDTDFGVGGIAMIDSGKEISIANTIAVSKDQKIIAGGYAGRSILSGDSLSTDLLVVRLNTDGTLDNKFGNNGITTTSIGSLLDTIESLVIQENGKIVVGGYVIVDSNSNADLINCFVARYNVDGTLDSSFGKEGISRVIENSSPEEIINDIALRSDGKIIAVGSTSSSGTGTDIVVFRFLPDGSLDSTFGSNGKVITDFNVTVDYATGVEIQPDGKILVAGTTNVFGYSFALVRYNQSGGLDKTFGENGKFVISFEDNNSYSRKAALQKDGKLLVVGESDSRMSVTRYDTNLPAVECEDAEIKDAIYFKSGNDVIILLKRREIAATVFINGKKQRAFWTRQSGVSLFVYSPTETLPGKIKVRVKNFCGAKSKEFLIME